MIAIRRRLPPAALAASLALMLSVQAGAQVEKNQPVVPVTNVSHAAEPIHFAAGAPATIQGIIVKRDADSFTVRDSSNKVAIVNLTSGTEVKEKKSNPFRRARNYGVTQLYRGLAVQVNGHGDNSGSLVADVVRFTDDDLRGAFSLESRVNPVENRLNEAETRLGQSEENAQRLSGQVSEFAALSEVARGAAKNAQETADQAMTSAKSAGETAEGAKAGVVAANERITSLDDFDTKESVEVRFNVGSAVLSKEARAELDKIAEEAKNERGYLIEVLGFASSDGSTSLNQALSQHRADSVIRYMAENHTIPLRRFITPFGYGETRPIADNSTRDGRKANRRVEVRVLVSKGLVQAAATGAAQTSQAH